MNNYMAQLVFANGYVTQVREECYSAQGFKQIVNSYIHQFCVSKETELVSVSYYVEI